MTDLAVNLTPANEVPQARGRLGRLPRISTRKALMFSDFVKFLKLPASQTYWQKKAPLPRRTYGNDVMGDCTRAKQAVAITRFERLEQRRLVEITDDEVTRVYLEMTARRYGGGDTGAYEVDALDDWRNPETSLSDIDRHVYTIDAYLALNPARQDELKAALALSAGKGISIDMNLPLAFEKIQPPRVWAIPTAQPLTGEWMPGSWGGHSMWANGYTKDGLIIDSTWGEDNQILSWAAVAAYVDEAHVIIDSLDAWRKKTKGSGVARLNTADIRDAVNSVSRLRIA